MALAPLGAMVPLEMNEGTNYYYGDTKGLHYGLGVLGLLGPSPPAKSNLI
jgi:hypothetical protein